MSQIAPQGPIRPSPTSQGPGSTPLPTLDYARPQSGTLNVRQVAIQQRAIMLCILSEFFIYILLISAAVKNQVAVTVVAGVLSFAVAITAAVFIFMLAITLYNTAWGIMLGIWTLWPGFGLLALLIVNGKATKVLRRYGIKVGLLGADPSKIPPGGFSPPLDLQ